jgi:hypothetical protein
VFLLGVLFYLSSMIIGVALVNYFLGNLTNEALIKYAIAFPIGFVIAAFLALSMEAAASVFSQWIVLASSLVMLALSYILYRKSPGRDMFRLKVIRRQFLKQKWFYISVFIVLAALLVLMTYGVHNAANGIHGADNYGTDFLFHVSIGNSVVYTGFPPKLLYIANQTNAFPFIADFYTSILAYTGINIVNSWYMTNYPLWYSLVLLSVYFISIIIKRRYAAIVGFLLFMLCSLWLNAVILYAMGVSLPYLPVSILQSDVQHGWINLFTQPIFNFSDPLVSNFAPQHDYLLGFPYALTLLILVYLAFFSRELKILKRGMSKEFLFAGLLVGLMPLVHPFSMVFIFIFALVALFYSLYKSKGKRAAVFMRCWLPFGLMAIAVAAPLILYIHSASLAPGFFGSMLDNSVWYQYGKGILTSVALHIAFWFETIGALLVLGLVGMWLFRKRLIIFLPAFIALALVNVIRLQPNFGDSNKIVIYFLLFMAIAAAELLVVMWKRGLAFKAIAVALFFAVTLSGFVGEYYALSGSSLLVSRTELNATSWLINNTPSGAVIADNCYNTVFGLISSVGRRRVVLEDMPYPASVGLYNESRNPYLLSGEIDSFMSAPSCAFIRQYNVSYVVLMNISNLAPQWCTTVNYTAFKDSPDFGEVKAFTAPYSNISVFRTLCG